MTLAASGLPPPSRDWKEKALDGEPELFRDFARDIVGYQKEDADKTKMPTRKDRSAASTPRSTRD